MEFSGVSHIAVCVRDLDKSLEFYQNVLGMVVEADRMQDTTSGGLTHVYKHSRQTRRQVRLALAAGAKPPLTLTCPDQSRSTSAR